MTTISVQVVTKADDRRDWLDACLASLQGQPVEVVMGDYVAGNLTAARLATFERMDGEWLSWVDPDDLIPAGAFAALAALAGPGVGLVTGEETRIDEDGRPLGYGRHYRRLVSAADILGDRLAAHRGIVHRDALPLARQIVGSDPFAIDWAMTLAGTLVGEVRKIPETIYQWRRKVAVSPRLPAAPLVPPLRLSPDQVGQRAGNRFRAPPVRLMPPGYDWDGIRARYAALKQELGR